MRAIQTTGLGLLLASVLAVSATAQTVTVPARGQTVPVGTVAEDAADDPAIWRDPAGSTMSIWWTWAPGASW